MSFRTLTLKDYLTKVKSKEIDPAEVLEEIETAIDTENERYNIYLDRNEHSQEEVVSRSELPLAGAPLAIKDNFLTKGMYTTASSNVLKDFLPPYESTVTTKLNANGAVFLGKTNMDAWAHGSSTETSDFGPTKNPRNPEYLPGGSSGGSAAAIAADLCIGAIGSETAGSIRQPAAWCGCVGLKPTYGRVSRYGVVAMGSSLDCPGPITKTVEDSAILLNAIAGVDPYDSTTSPSAVPDYTQEIQSGVKGMKIGIVYMDHPSLVGTAIDTAVHEAGKVFERLGASVENVRISGGLEDNKILSPDLAIAIYTVIQRSEVSSNLARYDGIRYGGERSLFGTEAKRRIMLGTFTLSKGYADKYYTTAQKVRTQYIQNFNQLFKTYDLLISASSPGYALKIGATGNNPMFGELQDVLVEPSAVAGLPGIGLPMYTDPTTNLSLGLDIVATYWDEKKILQAAYAFEQETNWNTWLKKEEKSI